MFPKESAIMILSKGKKGKSKDEDHDDEMDYMDDEEEEDMEDYSDEQHEMAEELISAVKSGDSEAVLDAIHGIYNSY